MSTYASVGQAHHGSILRRWTAGFQAYSYCRRLNLKRLHIQIVVITGYQHLNAMKYFSVVQNTRSENNCVVAGSYGESTIDGTKGSTSNESSSIRVNERSSSNGFVGVKAVSSVPSRDGGDLPCKIVAWLLLQVAQVGLEMQNFAMWPLAKQ